MCRCKLTLAVYLKSLYYLPHNIYVFNTIGPVEFLVRLANEKGNQCNNR